MIMSWDEKGRKRTKFQLYTIEEKMSELSVDHLIGIKSLTESDIQLIFDTANNFKQVINRPIKKSSNT